MAPPPRIMGDGRKAKDPKKTFSRLLKYLMQYKIIIFMVLLCILAAALVQSRSSVMLGTLVDEYILPMVANGSTDFQPILRFLLGMVAIFVVGLLAMRLSKVDFGSTCGMLCGSMANPMALNYANEIVVGEHASVAYATVYPLTMFLRVVIAQVVLMVFM